MSVRIKYIQIILIHFILFSAAQYSQESGKAASKSSPVSVITIASEPDYPPYCFINKEGNPEGFSVDLFRAAAKAVGLDVKIKIGVWNKIKQDLSDGKIDALPLVGRTPERETVYDFTIPYLSLHGAVFVRKGTAGINTIDDLRRRSIVVMRGDNAEEFARREKISDRIYTTNTFEEAFKSLAAGEYDAVITQRVMGLKLLESLGLDSIEPLDLQLPKFRQDFCFAVKKGDMLLLSKLNEGLSIIIANKKYNAIHEKWFGPAIKEEMSILDILEIVLYTGIPLILISSIAFIIFLRREVRRRTLSLEKEITGHKETLAILNRQSLLLQESEERWKHAIASSPVPVMIHNEDGTVLQISQGWTKYSGYTIEDIPTIGDWSKRAYGTGSGEVKEYIQKLFALDRTVSEGEWIITAKDGSKRIWDFQTTPLGRIHDGKLVIHSMAIDITERKKSEEELSRYRNHLEELVRTRTEELELSNKKLESSLERERELNELKTRFISTASHEFRTPLTIIHSSVELLERYIKKWDDKISLKHISKIIESVDYLTFLINDVLTVSRADAGKLKFDPVETDFHQFCLSLIEDAKLHISSKHRFDLDYRTGRHSFYLDLKHINTIMHNLVSNACKYSPDGGLVEIGVDSDKENLSVIVKDYGIGIPSSEIPLIFDRFHRASNSDTIQGTGLGLAIVKSLVEIHNGKIIVESELGKGTSIKILIPLHKIDPAV